MNWNYENGRIYSVDDQNELMAEASFIFIGEKKVNIDHTYVNPILRGQGAAGKMMEAVAEYFRKNGLKTTASCSYANGWLKKNREMYGDILLKELDDEAAACRIDGSH